MYGEGGSWVCPLSFAFLSLALAAEVVEDDVAYVGVGRQFVLEYPGEPAEDHPPLIFALSRCAVGAAHQRGIERDAARGRIEEQLHRIITRLAVNIHRAGEGGGFSVVEPPVVGLPTVGG